MSDARGQATIEWVGLLMVAALALGGLAAAAAGRRPQGDRALGAELTQRITCAAASGSLTGTCAGGRGARSRRANRGSGGAHRGSPGAFAAPWALPPAGAPGARAAPGADSSAGGRRVPGAAAAPAPRRAGDRPGSRAKAGDAFRRLRGAGKLTNRLWIVCLGYRRFLFESERVREPASTMPLREALDVADTCLNPLNFLGGD